MSRPLVSICVPNCNNGRYLEACLATTLSQAWSNVEEVLVDDEPPSSRRMRRLIRENWWTSLMPRILSGRREWLGARVEKGKPLSTFLSVGIWPIEKAILLHSIGIEA